MRCIIAAALVVAAPPLAASAQTCPTIADLATGVRLTRDAPFLTSLHTRSIDGLIVERSFSPDYTGLADTTTYAHPLTITSRVSGADRIDVVYGRDTAAIDDLDETSLWSSPLTITTNGDVPQTGTLTYIFVGISVMTLNDCTYKVWLVDQILDIGANEPLTMVRVYAPDLGISVGWDFFDPSGTGRAAVDYDQIIAE